MKLKGLYTALITPFDEQGNIDCEGLVHNIRYQLEHRVAGLVILGTTAESPTLTSAEKKEIMQIAKREIKGKAQLIIGTGSPSTQQTIETTLLAEEMGADAALVITPYYNKPTQEGIFRHFEAICKATSLPICLYNNPSRTAVNIDIPTLQRLVTLPTIIGVKDASANLAQMQASIAIAKEHANFAVLAGDDFFTFALMMLGGDGVIATASNLVPEHFNKLVHAALNGNLNEARQLHYELSPLFEILGLETNPLPIKAAMNCAHRAAGSCRLPLSSLQSHNQEKIVSFMKNPPSYLVASHG